MIALIKKDLDWLLILLIFGLCVFTYLFFGTYFDYFWILPGNNNYKNMHLLYSLGGVVLGIMAALREEFSRTEEFLLHRPVNPSQIYFTKLLACMAVMLSWIIIPLLLSLSRGFWSDNASIIRYDPLWYTMGTGAVMFSCFGVCFYAGTMRISLVKRAIVGGTGYLTLMYISFVLTRLSPDGKYIPVLVYVGIHSTFTLLALYAAYFNMIRGPDPDKPMAINTLRTSGSIAIVFTLAVVGFWISDQQETLQHNLFNEFPVVMDHESEGYILATWNDPDLTSKNKCLEVNERHEPVRMRDIPKYGKRYTSRLQKHWKLNIWTGSSDYSYDLFNRRNIGNEVSRFDRDWKLLDSQDNSISIHHRRSDGMIYFIQQSTEKIPIPPCKIKLGKGPEGRPFYNVRPACRFLPEGHLMVVNDGAIWYCDLNKNEKYFHRLNLPDEDRARSLREIRRSEITEISNDNYDPEYLKERWFLVEGNYAYYLWNGITFLKQKFNLGIYRFNNAIPPIIIEYRDRQRLVTLNRDPLSPVVALKNEKNEILFSHQFDLYTDKEKWLGAKLCGLSLCRIPLIQILSYFGTEHPRSNFSHIFLIDPLLASGKRFWLLATNLLLSACLAFLAIWRLIRFNAERNRLLYWGILIFLSGIGGYVVYRLFETKRAYRISTVVRPEEVPPMVIQSV